MKQKVEQSSEDFYKEMGFKVININPGNLVLCDGCNANYTDRDTLGGVLLSRSAFCPNCAEEIIKSAKKYKEEKFLTYPKEGESFKDFVIRMRDTPSDYQINN